MTTVHSLPVRESYVLPWFSPFYTSCLLPALQAVKGHTRAEPSRTARVTTESLVINATVYSTDFIQTIWLVIWLRRGLDNTFPRFENSFFVIEFSSLNFRAIQWYEKSLHHKHAPTLNDPRLLSQEPLLRQSADQKYCITPRYGNTGQSTWIFPRDEKGWKRIWSKPTTVERIKTRKYRLETRWCALHVLDKTRSLSFPGDYSVYQARCLPT